MSRPIHQSTLDALARVMAGEPISDVARATGVDRSLIHRRLKALGQRAPKRGGIGRPKGARDLKPRKRPTKAGSPPLSE